MHHRGTFAGNAVCTPGSCVWHTSAEMHDRRAFAGNAVCMTKGVILTVLGVFLTG